MKMPVCRVCQGDFFSKPLLRLENMPKAAQNFPDKTTMHLDKGETLEVFQCSSCGLVQLTNEPLAYYREVIRATGFSEEMKAYRKKQFAQIIEKYHLKDKTILELGCGKGEYLSLFDGLGVTFRGMEYAQDSVRICREAGLSVEQGFVESPDQNMAGAPFDAMFIFSFFEHLPQPNTILASMKHNMKDDAIAVIEVPDFDMILQKKMFSEFIPDHLFYFTRETLSRTLERSGFEILEMNAVWHNYIISAVVRKKMPLDLSHFTSYQEKLHKEMTAFLAEHAQKSIAVWGAGHQALAIMGLMNLGSVVKYVVDSAPFKQNKYTPASHLPIVAPETLASDPVDVLLVMAASYSDEIVRTVKQRYAHIEHIAVLRDFGLERLS